MSLINRMLQDLDSRHATSGKAAGLHDDVRSLPAPRGVRWPLWLGLVLGLCVLAAGAWYVQDLRAALAQLPTSSVRSDVPVTAAALPVASNSAPASAADSPLPPVSFAAPEAPVAALATPAPEVSAAPAEAPAPTPAAALNSAPAAERVPKLRLANDLHMPAKPAQAPRQRALSTPPSSALAPTSAVAERPAPVSPPRASVTPAIEKTPAAGSPRERAEADYRKAIGVLNQGRTQEAVELLQHALRTDAGHGASRQLLFKLLHEAQRTDEAAQLLREGLQVQPAQIAWAMSLARLQVDRGDFNGASQTLQASLPAAANSADYQGFAAHVLQRLGRHKEAAAAYATAGRLAPGDGRWWLGLGLALESDGRSAEARDAFAQARATGSLSADLQTIVEQKLR